MVRLRNRFETQAVEAPRGTSDYTQAKNIGILFHLKDEAKLPELRNLVERLENDGKKVSLLTFQEKAPDGSPLPTRRVMTREDISPWGKVRSEEAQKFANSRFDFLYCINVDSFPVFDHILMQSQAKCRIGKFFKNREACLDLMIDLKESREESQLIEKILDYSKTLT